MQPYECGSWGWQMRGINARGDVDWGTGSGLAAPCICKAPLQLLGCRAVEGTCCGGGYLLQEHSKAPGLLVQRLHSLGQALLCLCMQVCLQQDKTLSHAEHTVHLLCLLSTACLSSHLLFCLGLLLRPYAWTCTVVYQNPPCRSAATPRRARLAASYPGTGPSLP